MHGGGGGGGQGKYSPPNSPLSLVKPGGGKASQKSPLSSSAPLEVDLSVSSRSAFLCLCPQKDWQYILQALNFSPDKIILNEAWAS